MKWLLMIAASASLAGCIFEEDLTDAGYADGYAMGYNTTCELRSTLISGEWESASYSRAYAGGMEAGILACLRER